MFSNKNLNTSYLKDYIVVLKNKFKSTRQNKLKNELN